jgi:hypothetical protein
MTSPRLRLALLVLSGWLSLPAAVAAKVFLTTDEALALAFPDCSVERSTSYLDAAQLEAARKAAGVEVERAVVFSYRATCQGKPGGTAYFDTHRVRTLPETVMVVVDPDGKVGRIEVLAFNEPEDYLPKESWYATLLGRRLDAELAPGRGVRAITGATLTVRATVDAVRRVLAVHQVVTAAAPAPAAAAGGAQR